MTDRKSDGPGRAGVLATVTSLVECSTLLKCRALELQSEASHRENQQMTVLKNLLLPVNLW